MLLFLQVGALQIHSFGKMNSQKFKLNFMILQTNVAMGSTNFMIWRSYSQLHEIKFMNYITLFHEEQHIVYEIFSNRSKRHTPNMLCALL